MKSNLYPYAALVVGVLAVSSSAVFVRLSTAEPGIIAFYRLFFSTLLIFPFFWGKRKEVLRFSRKDWLFSGAAGFFLAFHFILWFQSLEHTTVASSVVLVTLQPIFSFLGTYVLFKEKVSAAGVVSALLAIGGSAYISWGDFKVSGQALYGDILALIACAWVTAYLLFGQHVRKRHSLSVYTFIVYGISAVVLLVYCLFDGAAFFSYPPADWGYFVLLAVIPTLLGHSLFNWVLKWLSTNMISVAILFEPAGAIVLAYWILHESVMTTQLVGGAVIFAGILLFMASQRNPRRIDVRNNRAKRMI
ncbi:DMT family transporter [Bacillus sp. NSP9.1]|uniref:DMT family transporter n=1 Tax=Bacillus sp. NSP9.1 TaxID=1071078 RepID=UPI00047A23F6|nr:DMT family transporter [Bacillus sp. NSP9.1]QHZ45947.1 DMT family transporter [Bacillus sp. NSP9.1]